MTAPLFPVILNLAGVAVVVVGDGVEAEQRIADLTAHGAHVTVFRPVQPPTAPDLARLAPRLVFFAMPPGSAPAAAVAAARASGAFVHVQDRSPDCDFHLPARLRRGKLLVTVSTDGAVAGLSRLLRDYVAHHVFGEDWGRRVEEVAERRTAWRAEGLSARALFDKISELVAARGWLAR